MSLFTTPNFIELLKNTPSLRYANLNRLIGAVSVVVDVPLSQITIRNYRDVSINYYLRNGSFIGDCIEVSMQQFHLYKVLVTDNSLVPVVIYAKNSKNWNHFMFALLSDENNGVVFENAVGNRVLKFINRKVVDTMSDVPFDFSNVVDIIYDVDHDLRLSKNDIYSFSLPPSGWDISERPFTSTIGSAVELGQKFVCAQLYFQVQKDSPYVDIIDGSGKSVLDIDPESSLSYWIRELRNSLVLISD